MHPWIDYVNRNVYSQSFVMWHRNGIVLAFSLNYELLLQCTLYYKVSVLPVVHIVKTVAPVYAFHSQQQKHNSTHPTPPHVKSLKVQGQSISIILWCFLSHTYAEDRTLKYKYRLFCSHHPYPQLFSFLFFNQKKL